MEEEKWKRERVTPDRDEGRHPLITLEDSFLMSLWS